jgi:hypothetical protein
MLLNIKLLTIEFALRSHTYNLDRCNSPDVKIQVMFRGVECYLVKKILGRIHREILFASLLQRTYIPELVRFGRHLQHMVEACAMPADTLG